MKKEVKPFSWLVKNFNINKQTIEDYDALKYLENDIKKLKKKCIIKEEFANKLRTEMLYHFWSRAEYELVVKQTEDGHILLLPWCGCRDEAKATIDVTYDTSFDWKGFAAEHIGKQIYNHEAKIDVYNQLMWQWDNFVNYVWNYRHKYQRKNLGGARANEI